jgi:hypothetical protein
MKPVVKVCTRKLLPDNIPIWNGLKQDVLTPLLSNLVLEYATKKVQEIQVGLKLNLTFQLLVYGNDVNLQGDEINKQNKTNSVARVRERTIPTERPTLVREVSANFCA